MRLGAAIVWLAVCGAGCQWPGPPEPEPQTPNREADLTAEVRVLQDRVEKLQARNKLLSLRVDELSAREGKLSERLQRAEFVRDRLEVQLDAVRDAPRQRDHYRQRVELLSIENERLAKKVTELQSLVRSLTDELEALRARATTRPARP
jgi:chromosome segregation ATPase